MREDFAHDVRHGRPRVIGGPLSWASVLVMGKERMPVAVRRIVVAEDAAIVPAHVLERVVGPIRVITRYDSEGDLQTGSIGILDGKLETGRSLPLIQLNCGALCKSLAGLFQLLRDLF